MTVFGGEIFIYKTTVTIGDTNLLQNMYFANYFKIQGVVREIWVNEAVENAMQIMKEGLILVTKSAHCNYYHDFYLYDEIRVEMHVKKLRHVSAELHFKFFNNKSNELHAVGDQEIVFLGANHKICKVPENFLKAGLKYSIEE